MRESKEAREARIKEENRKRQAELIQTMKETVKKNWCKCPFKGQVLKGDIPVRDNNEQQRELRKIIRAALMLFGSYIFLHISLVPTTYLVRTSFSDTSEYDRYSC